jgi:hypothetical protein
VVDLMKYISNYLDSMKGIVNALPRNAALPTFLYNPSFIFGYSDLTGKYALQLCSREKTPEIVINGKHAIPKSNTEPGIILFEKVPTIEKEIFPQDSIGIYVSIMNGGRYTVLNGLAFSSKEYNDKYWKDATFYRHCAGDIPFTVSETGSLLGLNILWGTELNGKRVERIFEYIKMFGNEDLLPKNDEEYQNETFFDFVSSTTNLCKNLENWSFTDFIKKLKGPVENNVLLLGSYKSEDEFIKIKEMLERFGYNGFLLKDSPDLPIQSNLEKLMSAIICSCFVIVVDKEASGHIAELGNMLQFRFRPVIVIRDMQKPTTAFLDDQILTDRNFCIIKEQEIDEKILLKYIKWARKLNFEKENDYNRINYWRK